MVDCVAWPLVTCALLSFTVHFIQHILSDLSSFFQFHPDSWFAFHDCCYCYSRGLNVAWPHGNALIRLMIFQVSDWLGDSSRFLACRHPAEVNDLSLRFRFRFRLRFHWWFPFRLPFRFCIKRFFEHLERIIEEHRKEGLRHRSTSMIDNFNPRKLAISNMTRKPSRISIGEIVGKILENR